MLRLLKDGLIGAVSIALKPRKPSDEGQNKLFYKEVRERGRTEQKIERAGAIKQKRSILFTVTDLTHHADNFPERF